MLSPVKLYKHDMGKIRRPVTFGPKGNACGPGSPCFRHPNVDWTVHRLAPAIADRRGKGSRVTRAIGKVSAKYAVGDKRDANYKRVQKNPAKVLHETSPRWGQGIAPGRRERKPVPLPAKGSVEVSGKTKAAVVGTVAAYGGYKAYQHRTEIRQKAAQVHNGVHNAFHSTKQSLGIHNAV